MFELLRGIIDFFIVIIFSLLLLQPTNTTNTKNIINEAKKNNIYISIIGNIKEKSFAVMNNNNKQEISIENLSNLRNNWFNNYFKK